MLSDATGHRPRLAELADDLIDADVGIVKLAGAAPRQAGAPSFFHYWAQAADTSAFAPHQNFAKAGGAADDPDRALAKAIGEAIERYCAAIYTQEDLPLRAADAAEFPVVDPTEFALNSEAQYAEPGFRFVPFNRSTPVRWAPMVDALSGECFHVPAAMVYVPYYFARGSGEAPIAQPISTGLACHDSFAEAAIAALTEVVERDAFTITWQALLAPPKIPRESLPVELISQLERFDAASFDVTLFDITLDNGIPTVLAVSRHASQDVPALVVAASASIDMARATRGALEELAHTGHYCQEIMRSRSRIDPDATHLVVDQQSHLNYWCDHRNVAGADFLFGSAETRPHDGDTLPEQPADVLDDLARRVGALGHRALLADLTTPDVEELGLSVVRAVIPGYHPLVSGHRYRALGGRRLWESPQRVGHAGITPETGDNPLPHPYP